MTRLSGAMNRSLARSGIDDEILLRVVINGLHDTGLQDHALRNASRLTTYQLIRTELLEIARTHSVFSNLPQPMVHMQVRKVARAVTKTTEAKVRD